MNISASAVSIKCLKLKIYKINIIDSYGYTDSKCQLLTRPNVLEYIDLFNPRDNMKQSFGRGCPVVYYSILLCFILSMAIVVKVNFARICSYYKNYASKVGTSL